MLWTIKTLVDTGEGCYDIKLAGLVVIVHFPGW